TDSALSRLNAQGRLAAAPFELIELLSICDTLNHVTDGAFDPTVQPLWALYAAKFSAGSPPTKTEIADTLGKTGWRHVRISAQEVAFAKDGVALTLNGIAQGYISDKVAALLRRQGVTDTLVNMGEIVALGRHPDGQPWRIGIADPSDQNQARNYRRLENRAIATSAPLGTVFDGAGSVGHILDPRTGYPGARWRQVSVIAPQASRADGLSTAFCLMDEDQIRQASFGLQVDLLP
ncbi:MAG: FAD:protein FMN transferase, partial [Alphaproteobacteria bacterium]